MITDCRKLTAVKVVTISSHFTTHLNFSNLLFVSWSPSKESLYQLWTI